MFITKKDPFTGNVNTRHIDATYEQYQAWRDGALIQDAFPNLSPEDREFIKTGITPESWDEYVGEEEEWCPISEEELLRVFFPED